MNSLVITWVYLVLAAICTGIANLMLKKARSMVVDEGLIQQLFNPYFVSALILFVANLLFFSKALEKLPVTIAYPIFAGIGFSILFGLGVFWLGESLSRNHLTGAILILTGIWMIAR